MVAEEAGWFRNYELSQRSRSTGHILASEMEVETVWEVLVETSYAYLMQKYE